MQVIPWNKGKKLPVEILTTEEVELLIRACSNRAPTGIRNRALIVCLWRCGLRVSEALALRPKDIDEQAGTIRVLHGKGNKARTVGIDPQALAVIQRWLDRRVELGITGRSPVFCTLDGSPVVSVYVRNLLKRVGQKAGIEKRVHPHGLPVLTLMLKGGFREQIAMERARQTRERLPEDCNGHLWKKATAWAKADFVSNHRRHVSDTDRQFLDLPTVDELVKWVDFKCEYTTSGGYQLDSPILPMLNEIERNETKTFAERKEEWQAETREAEYLHRLMEEAARARN